MQALKPKENAMADSRTDASLDPQTVHPPTRADIGTVPEGLDGRVQAAVSLIQHLRQDRHVLKQELREAKEIIYDLQSRVEDSGTADERLTVLLRERDQLLQTKAVAARRIETIIKRLGALGIE